MTPVSESEEVCTVHAVIPVGDIPTQADVDRLRHDMRTALDAELELVGATGPYAVNTYVVPDHLAGALRVRMTARVRTPKNIEQENRKP